MPLSVFALLIIGFVPALHLAWLAAVSLGIGKIVWDSVGKIREGEYSLDYIAFLAMVVSIPADQYLAGAVVALMITGGEALDDYASMHAESALRALVERIPKSCIVRLPDGTTIEKPIREVLSGEVIVVKQNELVPLDGALTSERAELDEANLTGEAMPVEVTTGAFIKSGNVNVGPTLELRVEGTFQTSTYMRIVSLVEDAKKHQAKVVKLAEKVNFPFTALALILSGGAFALSGEMSRALAVLVIATPCPLIIAAPVAFIGGLSRAARRNIIVKKPATLELLSRAKVIFFDKTGTLTLGEPILSSIQIVRGPMSEKEAIGIASAIEFHSIHPLARAMLAARTKMSAPLMEATAVHEEIGKGISGEVRSQRYSVSKTPGHEHEGISLSLSKEDEEIARFHFEDHLKDNVHELFETLNARGIRMEMLTGDRKANAEALFGKFGIPIRAECSPEDKFAAIDEAKKRGETVAMVGDGLNDSPALAHADIGIVFSGTENSAAIDAADAVILGRDVLLVRDLLDTAQRSMRVARQSIYGGVSLSTIGMVAAALGFVPPVAGALIQEVIDVVVILNSLRSAAGKAK